MNDLYKAFSLFLLCFAAVFFYKQCKPISKKQIVERVTQKDSLIYIQRTDTNVIIKYTNREFEYTDLLNSKDSEILDLKRLIKSQEVELKQLKYALSLNFIMKDTVYNEITVQSDSLITVADSTAKNLNYNIEINPLNKTFLMKYSYKSNYNLIGYYEGGFWRKKVLVLKIISDDPNNTISAKTFNIQPKKKIGVSAGFGVGIGLGYNNQRVFFTPTIGFNLILHKK